MYNASQRFGLKRAQRGIAAIEMAITLPVLLLLLVGTAELGRAFYQYNELTKLLDDVSKKIGESETMLARLEKLKAEGRL